MSFSDVLTEAEFEFLTKPTLSRHFGRWSSPIQHWFSLTLLEESARPAHAGQSPTRRNAIKWLQFPKLDSQLTVGACCTITTNITASQHVACSGLMKLSRHRRRIRECGFTEQTEEGPTTAVIRTPALPEATRGYVSSSKEIELNFIAVLQPSCNIKSAFTRGVK